MLSPLKFCGFSPEMYISDSYKEKVKAESTTVWLWSEEQLPHVTSLFVFHELELVLVIKNPLLLFFGCPALHCHCELTDLDSGI